jgi:hypothetical protein
MQGADGFTPARVALALGVGGAMFAFAPLGIYEWALALGGAGLALVAPGVFARGAGDRLPSFTIPAVIACAVALVVGLIGLIGADRQSPEFKINVQGLGVDEQPPLEDLSLPEGG